MATMSAVRIRSMYRRHKQAHEAVYPFSANSVGHSIAGFSETRQYHPPTSASAPPSTAGWRRPDWPDSPFRDTSQLPLQETTPCRRLC